MVPLYVMTVCAGIIVISGCKQNAGGLRHIESDDYKVYRIIIDSLCSHPQSLERGVKRAEFHLIVDSTLLLSQIQSDWELLPRATNMMSLADKYREGNGVRAGEIFAYYEKHFPNDNWLFIKDKFETLNQEEQCLDSNRFVLSRPHYFVEPIATREFYRYVQTGLPDFNRSGGFTRLSRVAFDQSGQTAVICFKNNSFTGGEFGFVLLSKESGDWTIRNLLLKIWI